jgi:phage terminase small subunit
MTKLTPKQRRFVQEYLCDLNATQAAIRAGYSARSAHVEGARLLINAKVSEAVQSAQTKLSIRTELTQDEVIEGLRAEATNTGEGSSHGARVAAWTQLGRHLGMFKDKVEHSGSIKSRTDEELNERLSQLLGKA